MDDGRRWQQNSVVRAMKGRDLLTWLDYRGEEIESLLDLAAHFKGRPANDFRTWLQGQTVALIFHKPSTRTRVSFEVAAWQLGALPLSLSAQELQTSRGETIEDTGRVLSRYVQGIVIRTYSQDDVAALAAAADVPVINGLTDRFHPCQALADLLTLKEHFGRLQGLRLVYVGDGNNMAHSLMVAGAKVGMQVVVCTPPDYAPDPAVVDAARAQARFGGFVDLGSDPEQCVAGADAIYTDVWTSMGQEAEREERLARFRPYQVNATLLGRAPRHAVVMHCLPAHRGEEITDELLDGPRCLIWNQAENRLHAHKAILAALLGSA